jgi:hypothetical protein
MEHPPASGLGAWRTGQHGDLARSLEGRFGFLLRRLFGFALWCVLVSHTHSIAQI